MQRFALANLSKQVFVIASEWMTFGAFLESPVTSCGGDRGHKGKELTEKAGKTCSGWITVFFLIHCSWTTFAEHACSFLESPCFIFMHLHSLTWQLLSTAIVYCYTLFQWAAPLEPKEGERTAQGHNASKCWEMESVYTFILHAQNSPAGL